MSARKDIQPVFDQNDLEIREKLCGSALTPYLDSLREINRFSGLSTKEIYNITAEFIAQVHKAYRVAPKNFSGKVCGIPFSDVLSLVSNQYTQSIKYSFKEESITRQLVVKHFLDEMVEEIPACVDKNDALRGLVSLDTRFTNPELNKSYKALLRANTFIPSVLATQDDKEDREALNRHRKQLALKAYEEGQ